MVPAHQKETEIFVIEGTLLWNSVNSSATYVLTIITHNPKYLDQFLTVLLETFTGLVFARQSKQGVTTLCSNRNYSVGEVKSLVL